MQPTPTKTQLYQEQAQHIAHHQATVTQPIPTQPDNTNEACKYNPYQQTTKTNPSIAPLQTQQTLTSRHPSEH
jgi:hypothetical protein